MRANVSDTYQLFWFKKGFIINRISFVNVRSQSVGKYWNTASNSRSRFYNRTITVSGSGLMLII